MSIQFDLDDVAGLGALGHRQNASQRQDLAAAQGLTGGDVIVVLGHGGGGGRQGHQTGEQGEGRMAPGKAVGFHGDHPAAAKLTTG
ncbi:hypothetical protein D3C86_1826930 [compost metagenome]